MKGTGEGRVEGRGGRHSGAGGKEGHGRAGQARAGQPGKCEGNAKGYGAHSPLQDKVNGMMNCETEWKAGQNEWQDREEDRTLREARQDVRQGNMTAQGGRRSRAM